MADATEYHERTNHSPESVRERGVTMDRSNKPRLYKIYENLPHRSPTAELDPPEEPALSAIVSSGEEPEGVPEPDENPDIHTHCHCQRCEAKAYGFSRGRMSRMAF